MKILRAGVIVFDSSNKVVLVTTVHKTNIGYPKSFPKGHMNKKESILKCAVRELYEETGIKRSEIKFLVHQRYSNKLVRITNRHDKAYYFIAKFVGEFKEFKYKKGELQEVEWYDVNKAYSLKELSKNRKGILRNAYKIYTNNSKFEIDRKKNIKIKEINTFLISIFNNVCTKIINEYLN